MATGVLVLITSASLGGNHRDGRPASLAGPFIDWCSATPTVLNIYERLEGIKVRVVLHSTMVGTSRSRVHCAQTDSAISDVRNGYRRRIALRKLTIR